MTMTPGLESVDEKNLPYWLMNVPKDQRPDQCPEFLLDISDRNKNLIELPQNKYHIMSWHEVQELIRTYRIMAFPRAI